MSAQAIVDANTSEAATSSVQVISPFPIYAVPRVFVWMKEFRNRVCDDFAPDTLGDFVDQWQREDRAGRRTWSVIRGGELGGVILTCPHFLHQPKLEILAKS